MQTIRARVLTPSDFAPFGEVIQTDGARRFAINDGSAIRYDGLARVDVIDGHASMSVFVAQPFVPPVPITKMERHPLGSQAFFPLDARRYLVVVARSGSDGQPKTPEVFLASGNQGVNLARGTWHHPLIALDAPSRFLVVDRSGAGENLDLARYEKPDFFAET